MQYHFKIHKEDNEYWAQGIELQGCFTQGKDKEDLEKNMSEALDLAVAEPADSDDLAPLPDNSIRTTKTVVRVKLDPKIALSLWLRYLRKKHHYTQKEVSEKLDFKSVYQYQRMESSKYNPTLKTLVELKDIFPELSIDDIVGGTKKK